MIGRRGGGLFLFYFFLTGWNICILVMIVKRTSERVGK